MIPGKPGTGDGHSCRHAAQDTHPRGRCCARGGLPEHLGLDVLDHDRVDELPPAVVGAEPARHVPADRPPHRWAPGKGARQPRVVLSNTPEKLQSLGEIVKSFSPWKVSVQEGQALAQGAVVGSLPCALTHLSLCSTSSTEPRRWRPTCVTRARMSLPGKEPAPSLHREPRH